MNVRNTLAGLLGLTGVALSPGCGSEPVQEPAVPTPPAPIAHTVNSISDFGTSNILVFSSCDMKDDYGRALAQKGRSYKGFSLRKQGSTWEGQYGDRDITVACSEDLPSLSPHYDIVNLRGHTGDMARLHDASRDHFADHTVLILGGCNGASFVDDFAQDNVAVFGGANTQDTANGNYLLLQMPRALETSSSWAELDTYLAQKSDRFDEEFTSPGRYARQ